MSFAPGTRLGPYEILAPLGRGGMGEVFEARDTRLDRRVAVKVVSAAGSGSASDGHARLEREARAIAALNHPHICTLFDVGQHDGGAFLVMELLQGETLARRLARGVLPLEDAIAFAIQIASALDRAHRHGIVHRDLKPGNIMLTDSGVKLVDFGLARLLRPPAAAPDAQTIAAAPLTGEGTIPGTLPYMAPEQLEGKPTDHRADLFAFGAVLYEMLAGCRPFDSSSDAALIGAILNASPVPVEERRPEVPPALARVVRTCLEKEPNDRWSSAHDIAIVLEGLRGEAGADSRARLRVAGSNAVHLAPRPAGKWRSRGRLAIALAAGSVLGVAATVFLAPFVGGGRQGDAITGVFSILTPPGTSLSVGESAQVSPDGESYAFVASDAGGRTLLYVRRRDSVAARALPGTDDATLPFWSPDSARLGFFARGSLWVIPVAGGQPQALAPAIVPRGGTWGRGDVIVFVGYPNDPPRQVPASGGEAKVVPLPSPFNERRWFPSFLPDGRRYLYLSVGLERRVGVRIAVASLDSDAVVELMPSRSPAIYAEPGYLLARRDAALIAQPFDATALKPAGAPRVIVDRVGFNPIGYQGFFSASDNGILAYREPEAGWDLAWFDRSGRFLGPAGQAGQYNGICLSHDGKRVVYDRADETGNLDIWSLDLASGVPSRLTFDTAVDFTPVCSPVDQGIVFSSLRAGMLSLFRQPEGSPGSETLLELSRLPTVATDWSRDGRWLLHAVSNPASSWDLWAAPLGGGKPVAVATTEAQERNGHFSPDGRFVAYTLQHDASTDVYVQPFPATGVKWQVSTAGGRQPVWSRDGKYLFYLSADNKLVEVEVSARPPSGFVSGRPRVVMETRLAGLERTSQGRSFALSPDGERVLVISAGDHPRPITVRLNWLPRGQDRAPR